MEWCHYGLVTLAALAVLLSWRVPHAVLWVGFGVFSYVTSVWWHTSGLPYGTVYGALTNVMVCAAIYYVGSTRWEMRLMSAFILMLLIDLLHVCGVIQTQYLFAVSLEVVNVYALLLIWSAGITERVVRNGFFRRRPYRRFLDHVHSAVFGQRKAYPKWWKNP